MKEHSVPCQDCSCFTCDGNEMEILRLKAISASLHQLRVHIEQDDILDAMYFLGALTSQVQEHIDQIKSKQKTWQ